MKKRISEIARKTKETDIQVALNQDGSEICNTQTSIGFFDHILDGFANHGQFGLDVVYHGDLYLDSHHNIEDVGIVVGAAIKEAVGDIL